MCLAIIQSDPSDSCFYNSSAKYLSRREVISLVVVGMLSLILGTAALYGYLVDPSWMMGAHILTGLTGFISLIIGSLIVTKIVKTHQNDSKIVK